MRTNSLDPAVAGGTIPLTPATGVLTYGRVILDVDDRRAPIELTVSAPANGSDLPLLIFSHGHGASTFLSSRHGYRPLVDFWAAHGFVVVQPTHLDSNLLGLRDTDDPEAPLFWRSRARDVHTIIDRLDEIEGAVPGLAGRIDPTKIVAAGHSMGGHTTCMLLGMQVTDPTDGTTTDLHDPRIRVGAVIAAPGAGDDLAPWAATNYPALRHSDFSTMRTPALVVAGSDDLNEMFSPRVSYRWDAHTLSPSPTTLLTLTGGEHMLGGVSGFDAAETTDENPERVATLRAAVWAYLRTALDPNDPAWADALSNLSDARVESP